MQACGPGFFLVYDCSPSEQLTGHKNELVHLGMAVVPREGSHLLNAMEEMREWKKWSKAGPAYKDDFVEFCFKTTVGLSPLFLPGRRTVDKHHIRAAGEFFWRKHRGELPKIIDQNGAGRARIRLDQDLLDAPSGQRLLMDDLLVICWLAKELQSFLMSLDQQFGVGQPPISLVVLPDRLPRDNDNFKVHVLRTLLTDATAGRLYVTEVSPESDVLPRDLLADNLAGLSRELWNGSMRPGRSNAADLFVITGENIGG